MSVLGNPGDIEGTTASRRDDFVLTAIDTGALILSPFQFLAYHRFYSLSVYLLCLSYDYASSRYQKSHAFTTLSSLLQLKTCLPHSPSARMLHYNYEVLIHHTQNMKGEPIKHLVPRARGPTPPFGIWHSRCNQTHPLLFLSLNYP